jgi:hypothetical protein
MAYRQHSAGPDPYQAPGDLGPYRTQANSLAAAEDGGMRTQPLLTQSQFLMGIGEQNEFADVLKNAAYAGAGQGGVTAQTPGNPAGMGENSR